MKTKKKKYEKHTITMNLYLYPPRPTEFLVVSAISKISQAEYKAKARFWLC